ncbi:IS200/IS605 family transposase [Haloferula sp. A504]|uniref:IS200/IS605 family transposase n=1 Tax=Haloferula sp. A504 TaxID=3373601 RepID=UPI0031BE7EE4|nr:IS200/IS605 family transposase [Verrucomicrobiaceae bacterium E54]
MPQSLSKLYIHLVFSTKNRDRILSAEDGPDLHAYMGGTLNGLKCIPVEINTEPDHAHLLFLLSRTVALSDVVGAVKKSATEWLRARGPVYRGFHWQSGYGAFSVSESNRDSVRDYIRNQREHQRTRTFQEEYRALLEKYRIDYDERYVWD